MLAKKKAGRAYQAWGPALLLRRPASQRVGSDGSRCEGGRVLTAEEVPSLGCKGLAEYLRAMGVKVTRAQQGDVTALRELVLSAMQLHGVRTWSIADKRQKV